MSSLTEGQGRRGRGPQLRAGGPRPRRSRPLLRSHSGAGATAAARLVPPKACTPRRFLSLSLSPASSLRESQSNSQDLAKASEAEAGGGERRGAKHRGGEPDPDPRSLACRVGAPRANLQARRDGPRVSPKMSSKIIGRTVSPQVRRATMSQNFVGPGVGAPRFWSRSRHGTAGGLCARHVVSLDHSFFLCWRYGMF